MPAKTTSESKFIPTVSRIVGDTLVELVYDPEKRTTGLVVSRFGGLWNLERELKLPNGDILVPYSASNSLIANRSVLLPSMPVDYGFKHELLADIQAFLHRYVDLSPLFEQLAAHYVLLSWVFDAFADLPYLRLQGDFGTGKTRGLMVVGALCNKAFFASGASTVSPIFHILDAFGGTLVLDEADFPYSDAKADLVKLLNNGTTIGMPVLRTLTNRHRELNPYAFNVFGPKLVAMRDQFQDPALESRFLTEETGSRPLRADIPVQLPKVFAAEALALRNRLLHFRLAEFFAIQADASKLDPQLAPRQKQMALPLLSLVDDANLRTELQALLAAQGADTQVERRESLDGRILAAALETLAHSAGKPVAVRDITTRCATDDNGGPPCSARWVGHVLRRRFRVRTRKSNGIYVVDPQDGAKLATFAPRYGLNPKIQL